ncbi:hypothetical protein P280DRAFT_486464 [Massarina eburnea CBS 473.64]|uniref:Xylanolytic transcriptional activator regulatory domain-containing protein n=1 Tax=Massarina eburnea CBS 473.64 TaxID=1395130 RepID=A0A6A6SET1_9PLEO|nr:hypothetical protein P280DRAFT_486464 [Massarina eburnea CBS 473.64]
MTLRILSPIISFHNVTMALPSIGHVLPIIKTFLSNLNATLPLLHDATLLRLVNFYQVPYSRRDPVAWAAINTVLALAYRNDLLSSSDTNLSVEYLNKAESVLSCIMLGDNQLLNIQASPDLTPSLILIGTTMRLAHKIGLHDRAASSHMAAVEARERACVFWMAYILDKDLSMRSKQPSIQLDDDVDLELSSHEVFQRQLNYVSRTDTSVGSGTIATRRNRGVIEERLHAIQSIACALEAWKASIPFQFSASMAPGTISPTELQLLSVLYSTSLACTTLLNQASAWNTYWIDGIRKYTVEGISPTLPSQWGAVVDEARQLTVLLATDRTTGCSHMPAMLLLTFNNMHMPQHDQLSLDNQSVETGLKMLNQVAGETQSEIVRSFHKTCAGLYRDAQRKHAETIVIVNSLDLFAYIKIS